MVAALGVAEVLGLAIVVHEVEHTPLPLVRMCRSQCVEWEVLLLCCLKIRVYG